MENPDFTASKLISRTTGENISDDNWDLEGLLFVDELERTRLRRKLNYFGEMFG